MVKRSISFSFLVCVVLVAFGPFTMDTLASEQMLASIPRTNQISHLDKDAERLLEKNGFVIVPTKAYKDMNDAYKGLHKGNIPIFVTTDSILHTTHLLFDSLLRIIEFDHLMGDLKRLTGSILNASLDDYKTTENAEVKKAVYANTAFFSVAAGLLNEKAAILPEMDNLINAELRLIKNHEGFKKSPVFGYLEDYSQYGPRGHYTRNEKFKSYFKAMIWYSRMGFYLNPSRSLQITRAMTKQLTRQALLILKALNKSDIEGEKALDVWERIYEPTTFFVGKTDDLDVHDYKGLALKIYGKIPGVKELADESRLEQLMSEARKLRKPRILSTVLLDTEDEKKGAKDITIGFRFMGQRFVPDSYIFQNLVYPEVKLYMGSAKPFTLVMSLRGPIRGFPRGLDLMAVMGSERAEEIIKHEGDSDYQKYNEQLAKLKKEFDLETKVWASSLYWSWLYCLKPLFSPVGSNAPTSMQNETWRGKALNTAIGSWAELRHDTILYAKQSYTMLAGGAPPPPQFTRGYVEPYPEVFVRVRGMIEGMRKGLVSRGLLDKRIEEKLRNYEKLLGTLEAIAKKEMNGEQLSQKEYQTIWKIASTLESVTRFPHEIMSKIRSGTDEKMAIIADVHTDPNSKQVLEEGVGYPFIIYVRVTIDGREQIVQGPVFSYYEFKQPMANRLTDEQWQQMLQKGEEPPLPPWTGEFIGQQN